MELHEENPFKIRSLQNASFKIDRMEERLDEKSIEELAAVDGIGKSLSGKIYKLIHENEFPELQKLLDATPSGVLDMLNLKGIGPKKVSVLWKQLKLESLGELLYACEENRLVELKGFGIKTQEQIRKAIEFRTANEGFFHYAKAMNTATGILNYLQKNAGALSVEFTGEYRRKNEILREIEFLIVSDIPLFHKSLEISLLKSNLIDENSITSDEVTLHAKSTDGYPVRFIISNSENAAYAWWVSTGSEAHINLCLKHAGTNGHELMQINTEPEIYSALKLQYIEPELREGLSEVIKSSQNKLPVLIQDKDIKGILHNHSTWSDGIHTLEEMAMACINSGYGYFAICDHSRSANYANGLSIERVMQQHQEIDKLNQKLKPFRIFKGIESDILGDGSLDYPDEILGLFDMVVASIHSGHKMDEQKATSRLIRAIENPFTTILGHPTGRLLLARTGYPVDHKKVIDACSDNNVVIELNSNPYRLDMDWRFIEYALSKEVMISINPDAHSTTGIKDVHFGICVARKGGLTADACFNAMNLESMEKYLSDVKLHRMAQK